MRLQLIDQQVNFSCGSCTKCCDQPWGTLIEAEKAHALDQFDFNAFPQLAGKKFYYKAKGTPKGYYLLTKGEGTRCVFLDTDGLCIIHKAMGPEAKPKGCLKFPYMVARTPADDRVSVDFGCPAVQHDSGKPLREQVDDVAQTISITSKPADRESLVAIDPEVNLTQSEADALIGRLIEIFDTDGEGDLWARFAKALSLVVGVRRHQKNRDEDLPDNDLADVLQAGIDPPEMPDVPEVFAYDRPKLAPSPARMLFAATLFRDTCPADAPLELGLLRRLTLMPKLMSLAKLSGGYASRLLGRNINISDILEHPMEPDLDAGGEELLLRYYRTRLWQRYLCGTRLSITAGLHQHIQDLNAIIFFARAEAQHTGQHRFNDELIRFGLNRVEFHLANQPRLFDQGNMIAWFEAQMQSPAVAMQSLRLMALRPAPADEPSVAADTESSGTQS